MNSQMCAEKSSMPAPMKMAELNSKENSISLQTAQRLCNIVKFLSGLNKRGGEIISCANS